VQHFVVLINGERLARLMIVHDVGVRARKTYVAVLEVMSKPAPAPKAEAAPKGAVEVAGRVNTAPADPVVDQYRRKLSMALF
jgi:putative thioredoxin